ncbi:MAG TPA: hypothetical protein VEU06_05185 [Micropepsaceae bacterium]|nr:hypothetical protein [Micropepsaceae bacterium]
MDRNPKGKLHKREDEDKKLDEALADTFPASDPPSQTDPNKRVGRTRTADKKTSRKSH